MGAIADGLRARSFALLVVLGPEELPELAEIRAALGAATYVHGLPVRDVAALLSLCAAVVTPDAGPMHLAIASGAPTIALFRKRNFTRWGPRPPQGEVVFDPAGGEVARVLSAVEGLARTG
jgi:heptosyltransferase-3